VPFYYLALERGEQGLTTREPVHPPAGV
jgi:hypothetical protein